MDVCRPDADAWVRLGPREAALLLGLSGVAVDDLRIRFADRFTPEELSAALARFDALGLVTVSTTDPSGRDAATEAPFPRGVGPLTAAAVLLAVLIATAVVSLPFVLPAVSWQGILQGRPSLIWIVALSLFAAACHEAAHAGAAVVLGRGRLRCQLRWGWLVLVPVLRLRLIGFWGLPKARRIAVAASGGLAHLVLAAISLDLSIIWLGLGGGVLPVLTWYAALNVVLAVVNLLPVYPLDGYWLLGLVLDRPWLWRESRGYRIASAIGLTVLSAIGVGGGGGAGVQREMIADWSAATAEGLTRRFGARVAVDRVSFTVPGGRILALLGPNGAGKTTTVRMLAGLLRPDAGRAIVAGFDAARQPDEVRRRVGLMTDVPGLYAEMRLRAYLRWYAHLYEPHAATPASRVDDLIDRLGLASWAASSLASLSRGTQQKVALARCLLHDPEVLLLDEPTATLDVEATIALRGLFAGLKDAGRAIILCTHNLAEAERVADGIVILIRGRVVHAQALHDGEQARTFMIRLADHGRPEVDAVARIPGIDPQSLRLEPGALTFASRDPLRTNPAVVAVLVGQGCGIVQMEEVGPSLEAIYLSHLKEAGRAHAEPDHTPRTQ